jgi:glutaredoxin
MNFTVYSKPNCPHCVQAKALIKSNNYEYQEVILDVGQEKISSESYITRDELFEKIPNAKAMPQIILNDKVVGGFAQLKTLLSIK